jgi:GR25 family glycosyltransferase involved in LPS biosynthesis
MNINKTFIINLESRPDRKEQILNEMKKQNISENTYEFFKAIRPTPEEVLEWNPKYCEYNKNSIHPDKFVGYTQGSLGCLKSHVEICRIALERGYENILILEDDTEFVKSIDNLIKYSNKINNSYDMLYLAGRYISKNPNKHSLSNMSYINNNNNTISTIKSNNILTTGSYCIKKPAMEYLINNINNYSKEIDVFYVEEIQQIFECYLCIPNITKQRNGYSDIQQNNVNYKLE